MRVLETHGGQAVVTALLLAWLLPAQAPQTKPEELCTVEGVITDAVTGQPVRKASVVIAKTFTSRDRYTATTDAAGKYRVESVPPGSYQALAESDNHSMTAYGPRSGSSAQGTPITLVAGQKVTGIDIKLIPYGRITGKVTNADGEPMAGVEVGALRPLYSNGKTRLTQATFWTTNDLGEYRLRRVQPGRYYLSAKRRAPVEGRDRTARPSREGYAVTYFPGTIDVQGAAPVEVRPGQTLVIDFKLARAPTAPVRGRIVNRAGVAMSLITISALPAAGSLPNAESVATPRPDGTFELPAVTPGRYYLIAQPRTPQAQSPQAIQEVEVRGEPLEGLVLDLIAPFQVPGTVRVEDADNVDLRTTKIYLASPLLLTSPTLLLASAGALGSARMNPDGTFTLTAGAGPRMLEVSPPKGCYVKSAKIGEMDLLGKDVDLSGPPGEGLQIVLSGRAGTITGVVNDEKGAPAQGARVVLAPEGTERRAITRLYSTTTADQYGKFTIGELTPGDYKLFAFGSVDAGAWMDPQFMKPLESRGKAVTVREGSSEAVELRLIPAQEAQ